MRLSNIGALITGGMWGYFIATTMLLNGHVFLGIVALFAGSGLLGWCWDKLGWRFDFQENNL